MRIKDAALRNAEAKIQQQQKSAINFYYEPRFPWFTGSKTGGQESVYSLQIQTNYTLHNSSIRLLNISKWQDGKSGDPLNGYVTPLLLWTEAEDSYQKQDIGSERYFIILATDINNVLHIPSNRSGIPDLLQLNAINFGTYRIRVELIYDGASAAQAVFEFDWEGKPKFLLRRIS